MKSHSLFCLTLIHEGPVDAEVGNIDVEVEIEGCRYSATFFTLKNLAALFQKNREAGECDSGLYFWAVDMILVEELNEEVIRRSIIQLLKDGEFEGAFSRLECVASL